ncbi:MAG: hypothetical protein WCR51_06250 [Planctomycetia bacterium]
MLGRVPLLASVDARRPAAWLALATAAIGAALLPDAVPADCPAPAVMAAVFGALLAVMAIGDAVPQGHTPAFDLVWLAERAAWPLFGWLLAAGGRADVWLAGSGALGIATGAALLAILGRRGLLAADAASATLVAAGCAGAAGWWADVVWPERMPGAGVAIGGFVGLAVTAGALLGHRQVSPATSVRYTARHLLTAAAMMGAMAGMVGWLFLAADLAAFDLVASLAWFVSLAVPAATLGDGVSHAAVWRRVERAAPHCAGGRLRLGPGRRRDGVLAAVTAAALLGWPPLVAAAVAGGDVARSWPSLLVVAALAVAVIVLLCIVSLGGAVGATPDTQLAVAIAGTCLCMAVVPFVGPGQAPFLLPRPFAGW